MRSRLVTELIANMYLLILMTGASHFPQPGFPHLQQKMHQNYVVTLIRYQFEIQCLPCLAACAPCCF